MNIKKTLSEQDLQELGLKCGLEIHQQLEGKKLFCQCPTSIRDDKPDFIIKRFLRASAGEQGIVDVAAAAETKKQKHFLYEGYHTSTCLVELDEEPPGNPNADALTAALQLAKLCNMHIADQLRFMRKTVVNGSNTSGFQRTALVATQGYFTTSSSVCIGVASLGLEEDSCKDVEKNVTFTTYNLSRLGIPLLELATEPDISTPSQAKEVAEHIGMLMRSLPNVKRGLGTIRQDVNISIARGVRVEIKGAQELKLLPTLLHYEALRQYNLLEIFTELKKRNATVGQNIVDVTHLFSTSTSKVITSALTKPEGVVLAVPLYSFGGLTKLETQPGRRYGSELSDYAKVMGVKGIFHADELPNYGITQEEKNKVFSFLHLDVSADNFLLIADTTLLAQRALQAAQERASDFSLRQEVRNATPEGTSLYMRPMPGASRMYPETDVQPIMLDQMSIALPQLLSDKILAWQKQFNLSEELAKRLIKDGVDIISLTTAYPTLKPSYFVDYYYSLPKQIEKETGKPFDITLYAQQHFSLLEQKQITPEGIVQACLLLAQQKTVRYEDYRPLFLHDVQEDIVKQVKGLRHLPTGAIIGTILQQYKGRIDGKTLSTFIQSILNS